MTTPARRQPDKAHLSYTTTRRALLIGTPGAVFLAALAQGEAEAASDDYVDQAYNGVAAYVLPGDDAYSTKQGLTRTGGGGVAAASGDNLKDTYDHALAIAVAPPFGVNAPGAGGFALLLDIFTKGRYPFAPNKPYQHPFANLKHAQKALVLADLDREPLLRQLPVGFGFGTFITLAALAAYSEFGVFDQKTKQLTGTPIGWELSKYGGVSDGWPELVGYWAGRRSVTDPDD